MQSPTGQHRAEPGGPVGSWAFAHWGGVFYVFAGAEDTSAVHAVHRNTGAHELVIPDYHAIVGAGVSTYVPAPQVTPP